MDKILAEAFGPDAEHLATEEKQRLLSRLLGRLAHEIRNPLSSLNIHVQLLEEDLAKLAAPTRAQVGPRLEIIHGELHRLENIVKHFLRLARPTELDPASVHLPGLVGHVCELLRPEAAAQQTELLMRLEEPLPQLMADAAQLTQALVNLVINALQAVQKGGRVEVVVFASPADKEVTIEVRDTGPGLSPDKLGAVFEPYYTTKEEGSGLGLWIARQIATVHQGSLRAGNAPGGGAVFTLKLPWPQETAPHGR
jgi:signal transduction histidine kinase